jgi:hypothetical protein
MAPHVLRTESRWHHDGGLPALAGDPVPEPVNIRPPVPRAIARPAGPDIPGRPDGPGGSVSQRNRAAYMMFPSGLPHGVTIMSAVRHFSPALGGDGLWAPVPRA